MKRILIIDDENISVEGIVYNIQKSKIDSDFTHVKTCSSGLTELSKGKYDLIILDMMLPKGEFIVKVFRDDQAYGLDVLKEIRVRHIKIPVICYTILPADQEMQAEIRQLSAVYIGKLEKNASEILRSKLVELLSK